MAVPDTVLIAVPLRSVAAGRAGDDAEQRPHRELEPGGQPRLQLLPCPVVHADLASASALAATDQHGAAARVEVGFGERERLADRSPARHNTAIRPRRRCP